MVLAVSTFNPYLSLLLTRTLTLTIFLTITQTLTLFLTKTITLTLTQTQTRTPTGVSLAIAYVVLAVSTFNPYLSLLATINIMFVVVCILGGTWLRGWEMGTIESISATILVRMSFY